jgi:hypothetical protein
MSLTRAIYDECSYRQDVGTQANALTWQLDPVQYEHCNECRMRFGIVGGSGVSRVARPNVVDLESDLMGLHHPASHCVDHKHLPAARAVFQPKRFLFKQYPPIDARLQHLPSCQLATYASVPKAPQLHFGDACGM